MDEKLLAALIGAGAALAVSIIKDIATPILVGFQRRRTDIDQALERYAAPLAESSISVFFRLREILEGGRHQFLMSSAAPTDFHRYKYESTVYRVCSLLGWIWALKKESSLLIDRATKNPRSLYQSVERIESAFADGPHVEIDRLTRLSNLWGLKLDSSSSGFERASIEVNSLFHNIRYTKENPSGDAVKIMDIRQRDESIENISRCITEYFGLNPLDKALLLATAADAAEILSPRQAWIFRDWQSAIGHLMMKRVELGVNARIFDLIEFDEFLIIYRSGNEWLRKIEDMIRDLDPNVSDDNEYRIVQLRRIYGSVANIIKVLSGLKLKRAVVTREIKALVDGVAC